MTQNPEKQANGLYTTKGIELLAAPTPNNHKVLMLLEELKDAYGLDYTLHGFKFGEREHKQPWFTALNPTAKTPVLIDHNLGPAFAIPESQAIIAHISQTYDTDFLFNFQTPQERIRNLIWLCFANSELGPQSIAAIAYYRSHPERLAYPTHRHTSALRNLFRVLDNALRDRDFLVGEHRGRYSVADMACFPFVFHAALPGLDPKLEEWPSLKAWQERIKARPAVQRAFEMPEHLGWDNDAVLRKLESEPEFMEAERELRGHLVKATEEFGSRV